MAIDWRRVSCVALVPRGRPLAYGIAGAAILFSMASFRHIRRLLLAKYTKAADEAEVMARSHRDYGRSFMRKS